MANLWSLVLKSLTSVDINLVIEAKIFDLLVNAFMVSSEEIQQITYPQILAISQTIASNPIHSNEVCSHFSHQY